MQASSFCDSVTEKFLRYVKLDTGSDESSGSIPSTMKQHELAKLLVKELETFGAEEVFYDKEHCYVYASIPASDGWKQTPVIGFIAHMDTSPEVSGANVSPRIIRAYDGGDILLNKEQDIRMRKEEFTNLAKHVGKDLIVTDGTTLLGADDKAGIAEIMTMAEYLLTHPEEKHGKIRIAFTPDEEIGRGADWFDVERFGADFAYTVDGGALGELEYENFNAAGAKLIIHGRSVHPGDAKGRMRNAILLAGEFHKLLPAEQNPMYTEGYEGFFHLEHMQGTVEEAVAEYLIRDHDRKLFEQKKQLFQDCADFINKKYGQQTAEIKIKDSYYNMSEEIKKHMHLIENACQVMEELGIQPLIRPIRGGTDGAKLSFMGLPCPNLCTGGENYHGRYEFVCIQSMAVIAEFLIKLTSRYGEEE